MEGGRRGVMEGGRGVMRGEGERGIRIVTYYNVNY